MKAIKTLIFAAATFMAASAATAAVPENAYMIGDATPSGWRTDEAVAMQKDGDTFTYEGYMVKGQLKILTDRKFECPTFRPVTNGQEVNQSGLQAETVAYYENGTDNKWEVKTAGMYRVTLKVAADPVTDNGGTISFEYLGDVLAVPHNVYLIGAATFPTWSTDNAIMMKKVSDNVFTYDGILIGSDEIDAEGAGELKFLSGRKFEFRNYQAPEANYQLGENGIENQVVNCLDGDNKWKVSKTGMYHLTLTFKTDGTKADAGTLTAVYDANPSVYMLGLAANQFNAAEAKEMTKNSDGTYSWTGDLDYAATDGNPDHANKQFKFCFPAGEWDRVMFLVPEEATSAGVTPVDPGTYKLKTSYEYKLNENGTDYTRSLLDAFYGLKEGEKGNYKITVDPKALTMTLAKNTGTGIEGIEVEVEAEGVEEVYDLNGRKVSLEGAPAGVYIVRKAGNAKKVVIR